MSAGPDARRPDARRIALDALVRIDVDGAYANLVLPPMLARSQLSARDRAFATELVYGATRLRGSLDWAIDRFVRPGIDVEPQVRNAMRLGAYQLLMLGTSPHAAVSTSVDLVPARARGFVNAVLRKIAGASDRPPVTASYPTWIVERLKADLGVEDAAGALAAMNAPAPVHRRDDGYVQDLASQWVADLVGARPGERVADLCAGPGGKATAMAHAAHVVAADARLGRARLVAGNAVTTGTAGAVSVVAADATAPPFADGVFDRVLVDAPCSGLGVLRRRPDARWHVQPDDVDDLAALQRRLVDAAVLLLRDGGLLVYSVCTMTKAETVDVDRWLSSAHPDLVAEPAPGAPWRPLGRGALILPQTADTDGMYVLRLRRPYHSAR
jgi:16S rRNA (cytosine967-C5)-methyltransferase